MFRFVSAALCALLTLALVGCSSVAAQKAPETDAEEWPEEEQPVVVPAGYEPLTDPGFTVAMSGAMYEKATLHVEMDAGTYAMSVDMRVDSQKEVAMAGLVTDDAGTRELITVDGYVYLRNQGDTGYGQLPEVEARQMMRKLDEPDLPAMIADLQRGLDTLDYLGEDELDGVALHRYRVTMLDEYVVAETGIASEDVPDLAYDIWLDDDHLAHRWAVRTDADRGAFDLRVTDWGKPVDIEAPPASQVHLLENGTSEAA